VLKPKFGLDFRPQSPLTRSAFETERYIGNLKQPPGTQMIGLCFSSHNFHPSHNFTGWAKVRNLAQIAFDEL